MWQCWGCAVTSRNSFCFTKQTLWTGATQSDRDRTSWHKLQVRRLANPFLVRCSQLGVNQRGESWQLNWGKQKLQKLPRKRQVLHVGCDFSSASWLRGYASDADNFATTCSNQHCAVLALELRQSNANLRLALYVVVCKFITSLLPGRPVTGILRKKMKMPRFLKNITIKFHQCAMARPDGPSKRREHASRLSTRQTIMSTARWCRASIVALSNHEPPETLHKPSGVTNPVCCYTGRYQ